MRGGRAGQLTGLLAVHVQVRELPDRIFEMFVYIKFRFRRKSMQKVNKALEFGQFDHFVQKRKNRDRAHYLNA